MTWVSTGDDRGSMGDIKGSRPDMTAPERGDVTAPIKPKSSAASTVFLANQIQPRPVSVLGICAIRPTRCSRRLPISLICAQRRTRVIPRWLFPDASPPRPSFFTPRQDPGGDRWERWYAKMENEPTEPRQTRSARAAGSGEATEA